MQHVGSRPRLSSGESAPVRSRRPGLLDAAIAQTAGEFFNIGRGALSSRSDAEPLNWYAKCCSRSYLWTRICNRSSSTLPPHDGSPALPALLGAVAVVIGLTTWLVRRRDVPAPRHEGAWLSLPISAII